MNEFAVNITIYKGCEGQTISVENNLQYGCDSIKKIIFCLLVVAIMISSLAFVSADFSYHKIQVSNGTLTIDNNVLKIPEGYVEDMDFEKTDEPYQNGEDWSFSGVLFNRTNSSDYFTVFVTYTNDGKDFSYYYPQVEYVNVTINGVEGCLFNGTNESIFSYVGKGNVVEFHLNSGAEI